MSIQSQKNLEVKKNQQTKKANDEIIIQKLSELGKSEDKKLIKKYGKDLIVLAIKTWASHDRLRIITTFIKDLLM